MILCLWLLCIWFIFSARAGSEKSKIAWEFRGMSRAISFGSQWVKQIKHATNIYKGYSRGICEGFLGKFAGLARFDIQCRRCLDISSNLPFLRSKQALFVPHKKTKHQQFCVKSTKAN